jgi:hypothetical protein
MKYRMLKLGELKKAGDEHMCRSYPNDFTKLSKEIGHRVTAADLQWGWYRRPLGINKARKSTFKTQRVSCPHCKKRFYLSRKI